MAWLLERRGEVVGTNPNFHLVADKLFFASIKNYAEANAVSLPGWYPGFKDFKVILLPSSTTRLIVYSAYNEAMQAAGL